MALTGNRVCGTCGERVTYQLIGASALWLHALNGSTRCIDGSGGDSGTIWPPPLDSSLQP